MLENGGNAIGFLGDSLLKQSISKQFRDFISSNKLLLLSSSNPEAGFSVGLAMQRNKYIYCMSEKSVIVTCTPNKGGTWAGALGELLIIIGSKCMFRNHRTKKVATQF